MYYIVDTNLNLINRKYFNSNFQESNGKPSAEAAFDDWPPKTLQRQRVQARACKRPHSASVTVTVPPALPDEMTLMLSYTLMG
jgi:hypothetical protein